MQLANCKKQMLRQITLLNKQKKIGKILEKKKCVKQN
jgi:hypothetical protein